MSGKFTGITEAPGVGATSEQLSMLLTRYHLARDYCKNKRVLEVACGAGMGLSYIAADAIVVTGGDIEASNVALAASASAGCNNVSVVKLDAHNLDFDDSSFDLVILFEAIYYLHDVGQFLGEVRRVLSQNGILVLSSVNCEWAGFSASPHSTRYFSSESLRSLLSQHGFESEIWGAFPDDPKSVLKRSIATIRRLAVAAHLIPRTMKGKQLLKRMFIGKLTPTPRQISDDIARTEPLVEIKTESPDTLHKIIYCVATTSKSPQRHSNERDGVIRGS